jgi:hypothetical protein
MTLEEAEALKEFILAAADAKARKAVADLEKRLADDPPATFRGAWDDSIRYRRGNMVQFGGSIYHCDRATTNRPDAHFNSGSKGDWTLVIKKGRAS